jgi:hypothetical protein
MNPIDEAKFKELLGQHEAGDTRTPAVFKVDEVLEIRNGRFRVKSIGKRAIVLRSLPGTDIKRG